ncbi:MULTISPECIES: cation:proton antiporter [unclassified Sphingopyxis]|uniref:cation:proton antiporter n=1 Tax=unclassified Sphingopyxis TaxID=2614943 RepID=UPI0028608AD1|nr:MULTISPECIES: cation:proton antiporter [unclassified Sphingopyxis]MDR6834611.1 Kef-type K+ transport system membrane component KefB [Sphingopyxis sp. BE122]MDR7226881.1 Kef-type K+ transport system membrane component KefB [Sphingopyxis sp. BE259]
MTDMLNDLFQTVGDILGAHGPAVTAAQSYTPTDYSIHFFLQIAVILLVCRVVGWAAQKFLGQPQVVGEMIAGVLLGPSLFGLIFPDLQAALFPKETRNILYVGAQVGVGLYMFLVGTTLRLDHFQSKAKSAVGVSVAGIVAPFMFAALITPFLLDIPGLFAEGLGQGSATLFMGACIALTAFPMLARIINERGLANTSLGTLTLTAGAFDDAVSWCVLAIVLATFGGGPGIAMLAIIGGLGFAAFMYFFGRRLLIPLGRAVEARGEMSDTMLSIVLMLFALCAFVMDAAGIHAVFGGFILGVCMPRGKLTEEIKRKVGPITILLVPVFFTYSGLNTQLSTVNSLSLLGLALVILLVSIAAKFGACWLAARLAGEDNRTALGIGALMNARGLMELIIINIGLQKGIIGPTLFAIMVLMAIVTTVMAGPLFEIVYGRKARAAGELGTLGSEAPTEETLKVRPT